MTADEDSAAEGGAAENADKAAARTARGKRQKPPVTIDLEAAPAEPAGYSQSPSEGAPPEPNAAADVPSMEPRAARTLSGERREGPDAEPRAGGPSVFALVVAGIVGGLIALLIGVVVGASGILPAPGREAAEAAAAKANEVAAAVALVDGRVAALETRVGGIGEGEVKSLAGKVAALEAADARDGGRIEALESAPRITGAPALEGGEELRLELDRIGAQVDALADQVARIGTAGTDAGGGSVAVGALAELGDRLALIEAAQTTLSGRVAAIAARPAGAAESERAARAVAVGVVRQAAERGGTFAGDLAMLQTLGLDDAELAALQPLAAKGAPSLKDLQAEFAMVADTILDATSAAGPDAGFLDRVAAFGRNLVSVRPTSPISGGTPEAIVSRMQAAVDGGDLSAALDEREALPESGKAASAAWASAAADRAAIDGLIDRLAGSLTPPAQ